MSEGVEEIIRRTVWAKMRTAFFRGLVIFIPVAVTVWFVTVLFNMIDGIIAPAQPVLEKWIGTRIPGLGVVTFVIVVLVLGFVSRFILGTLLLKAMEKVFTSIPLVRSIYSATKDLLQAFSLGKKGKTFRKVLLVEYPRKGIFTVGFMTNEVMMETTGKTPRKMVSIYVPNPPNPTSGVLILVPESDAKPLDMSVEEGLKMVLSGGIVSPAEPLRLVAPVKSRPVRQRRKRGS
ncbi:MAG: DUF502 domain-containing protein [Bacteroidota bacterium]|jgi:uncharacterized membrane protein